MICEQTDGKWFGMRPGEERTPTEIAVVSDFSAKARVVIRVQNVKPRRDVRALGRFD